MTIVFAILAGLVVAIISTVRKNSQPRPATYTATPRPYAPATTTTSAPVKLDWWDETHAVTAYHGNGWHANFFHKHTVWSIATQSQIFQNNGDYGCWVVRRDGKLAVIITNSQVAPWVLETTPCSKGLFIVGEKHDVVNHHGNVVFSFNRKGCLGNYASHIQYQLSIDNCTAHDFLITRNGQLVGYLQPAW
jgi:hypothetical protein